ncbi:MAG: cytochrome c [Acidobacteria bacterium]|nr:cytochrome c [Acidobacteriota bacterium]
MLSARTTAAGVVPAPLCLWHSSGAQDASRSQADAKKTQVKELFVQRCARCHGRDGRGATKLGEIVKPPDFTDADRWRGGGVSDARLRAAIAEGKGEMPAFAKKLTRAEIAALAAYVRAFAPDRGNKR